MAYFVVNRFHGASWVDGQPRDRQAGWPEHRDFMNALPDGFVILGGPVGDDRRAMFIVRAADPRDVRRILDLDPWVRSGHLVDVVEPLEIVLGNPS